MIKLLKNMDYSIPILIIVLVIYGLIVISSATSLEGSSLLNNPFLIRQVAAAFIGVFLVIFTLLFNYKILRDYSGIIYVFNILLLLSVLLIGETIKGGQRWIMLGPVSFQPSELSKVLIIITLAHLLADDKFDFKTFKGWIIPSIHLSIPFLLILRQNDLGTALVLISIFVGMIYVAGASGKFLLGSGCVVAGGSFAWLYAHIHLGIPIPLQGFRLNRLLVLIDPQIDPLGSGYNVIQSMIAIGSGGFWGRGLFRGTQNRLRFLPERHTDFIFSVLGEELGFVGAIILLALYFILIWKAIIVANESQDDFGRLLVAGVVSMLAFHIFENIGMTIGIMPVTGLPLPFISYGGSSLITNLLAVGLIINVNIRRKKLLF
ncbi:rod shape-determining protein RodA [Halonatronum saccharophilum]|uniref:rod shape-determining protein RodA n=1 Tax=Halonatronum saccharophilum TaxID=150060 RepID=UPI00048A2033|nr:rod shape-determining protein RodA [Halonatronum saccharophilum]